MTAAAAADPYAKLRPGPGKKPAEVASHQRERLYAALVELVASQDYGDVTLRSLTSTAKVSSRAFYQQFQGKEDCFLRCHEMLVRRTAKRIVAAQAGERGWLERLQLAFRAALREVERDPTAAQLILIEAYRAGPAARAQARRAECSFETMLADSFRRAPDGIETPPLVVEGIVAGLLDVLRQQLDDGEGVPAGLANELLDWALACRQRAFIEAPPLAASPLRPGKAAGGSRSNMADRDLILVAAARLLAEGKRDGLTASAICASAGVTLRAFRSSFRGEDECLGALARECQGDAMARVIQASEGCEGRQERVHGALAALCEEIVADPVLARLSFTMDWLSSPANRLDLITAIANVIFPPFGAEEPPSELIRTATAGMIWGTIAHRVASGQTRSLSTLAPKLTALAVGAEAGVNRGGVDSPLHAAAA